MRRRRKAPRGSALVLTLFLMAAVAVALGIIAEINASAIRAAGDDGELTAVEDAAAGAVAALRSRLAQAVSLRLGDLSESDLEAIRAGTASLPAPPEGMEIVQGGDDTGVRLVSFRRLESLPVDERATEALSHQTRRSYGAIPPQGGRIASETYGFLVYASVRDGDGRVGRARVAVTVSRVPPHQDALYVAGEGLLCASSAGRIQGGVTVDGSLHLADCGGPMEYRGRVSVGRDLRVEGDHRLSGIPLASVDAGAAEADPHGATAAWGGRLRLAGAFGDTRPGTRFATPSVAGSGECLDFQWGRTGACGGAAAFHPSLLVMGWPGGRVHRCGTGYGSSGCDPAAAELHWHPRPFSSFAVGAFPWSGNPPETFWKGLFPDARRESRCLARFGADPQQWWRTFRCPTNAWGWVLDGAALPPILGGVLAVARGPVSGGDDPEGVRQTLLIRNARRLSGPLTIVSQLPVAIIGSYNVEDPKPSMIQAPRITILPAEAENALRTTAVWDSVPPAGGGAAWTVPLVAQSNVTLYAVLRTGTCNRIGAEDFGGSFRAAPAVLGDWSRVSLRVVGGVEVEDETALGRALCARWWGPLDVVPPSGTATVEPRLREILYDPRLLHPAWQPPGTWRSENIPEPTADGAPTRTPARQTHAFGGYTLLRGGIAIVRGVAPLPPAVPFTTTIPPLPATPPALP